MGERSRRDQARDDIDDLERAAAELIASLPDAYRDMSLDQVGAMLALGQRIAEARFSTGIEAAPYLVRDSAAAQNNAAVRRLLDAGRASDALAGWLERAGAARHDVGFALLMVSLRSWPIDVTEGPDGRLSLEASEDFRDAARKQFGDDDA